MRAAPVLLALLAAALVAPVAPPSAASSDPVHVVLQPLRQTETGASLLQEQEGADPRFFSIVDYPVIRGKPTDLGFFGSNDGVADFGGVIRVRSQALGLHHTEFFHLRAGWIYLGHIVVDTRWFQGAAFDLAITLEDGRGVVERWSRVLAVRESNPCLEDALLVGSGGIRDARPDELVRYGILVCNGTDAPRTATILFRDSATERPIVGALTLASLAYNDALDRVYGTEQFPNQYRITVKPGWYASLHYTLEEVPGVATLRPEALVLWDGEELEHATGLDVATFTLGEDLGMS